MRRCCQSDRLGCDNELTRISNGVAIEREDSLHRKCRYNSKLDWIVVRDTHPPIVSRHIWERANFLLREIRQCRSPFTYNIIEQCKVSMRRHGFIWSGPSTRFLLSTLVRCAHCGSGYEGLVVPIPDKVRRQTATGRQYQYSICMRRLQPVWSKEMPQRCHPTASL